jgi:hypothetical protein
MRHAKTLVTLFSTINLLFQMAPALASPLTFSAAGPPNFDGDVTATTIGGIALPKGSVNLTGNTIEVSAVPDWMFDKHPVLNGVVFNQQVDSTGQIPKVTGQAYFLRGEWLKELGRTLAPETVTIKDGTDYSGHIGTATDTTLEMVLTDGTRKSVPLADITSLTSPRAFTFEIFSKSIRIQPADNSYTAEAMNIRFKPAMFHSAHALAFMNRKPAVPTSRLPGTEGGISDKAIDFMVINDIAVGTIANVIGIPIAFSASTLHSRQLLFIGANNSAGQPLFSPQVYANGSVHFYPQ